MKITLTTRGAAIAIYSDTDATWSWPAAEALAEFYEGLEQDTGTEIELDVVAIRCSWSEHANCEQWAIETYGPNYWPDLGVDLDGDETDEDKELLIQAYIHDHFELIKFHGGVLVFGH